MNFTGGNGERYSPYYFSESEIVEYPVAGGSIYFDKTSKTIIGSDPYITEIIIPKYICGTEVEAILSDAFINCNHLEKVYCIKGSFADNVSLYSRDIQILYIDTDILLGDANKDGNIDSKDASIILQFASTTQEASNEFKAVADVNGDGYVDSKDASLVLQYVSGSITEF